MLDIKNVLIDSVYISEIIERKLYSKSFTTPSNVIGYLNTFLDMTKNFITALNAAVGGPNLLQGGSRTKKHKLKRSKKHIQTLKRKTKNNKKNTKKSMF
jgi:hypothetical protein